MNCGFRVTASGGEDSISNMQQTPALGAARVYAQLGDKLEWSRWVEAIDQGRTFITNGPLVELRVDGELPGAEIQRADPGTVEVSARLETAFPVDRFELIFRGEVVKRIPLEAGGRAASWRGRVEVPQSGWFTLRALSDKPVYPIDDTNLHAETSAVYVIVGDKPIRSKQDAEYFIRWIDDITRQAAEHPGWRSEREKEHVLGQFREARQVFEERAR
jgi:hypothetical protein